MKRATSKWITALLLSRAGTVKRHARLCVSGSGLPSDVDVVGRHHETVAIDDAATRYLSNDVEEPRIVLEPAHAVGLQAKVRSRDQVVGMTHDRQTGHSDQKDRDRGAATAQPLKRHATRRKDCAGTR